MNWLDTAEKIISNKNGNITLTYDYVASGEEIKPVTYDIGSLGFDCFFVKKDENMPDLDEIADLPGAPKDAPEDASEDAPEDATADNN